MEYQTNDGKSLDMFCRSDFDPATYAQKFYTNNTAAQAKAFTVRLANHKREAATNLQDKIFHFYPDFIQCGQNLGDMEKETSVMRRCLGKSEFILGSMLEAARELKQGGFLRKNTKVEIPVILQENESIARAIELSKFRQILALGSYGENEQWILASPDSLARHIFYGDLDHAVDLISRIRKAGEESQVDITSPMRKPEEENQISWALRFSVMLIEEKAEELTNMFLQKIAGEQPSPRNPIYYQTHPVRYLRSLDRSGVACRSFLQGRANFLKQVIDEVLFSRLSLDPEECVLELAQRTFRGVLDTYHDFHELFTKTESQEKNVLHNTLLSRFMVWANDQVVSYCRRFIRFLLPGFHGQTSAIEEVSLVIPVPFNSEISNTCSAVIFLSNEEWGKLGNCLRWTLLMCKRLEKDGLSFSFVVAREMKEPLDAALLSMFNNLEKTLRYQLSHEIWCVEQLQVESNDKQSVLCLTESGQKVYEHIHSLMRRTKKIYSTNYSTTTSGLEAVICESTVSVLRVYLLNIVHVAGAWPTAATDGSIDTFQEYVWSARRRGEPPQRIIDQAGFELSDRDKRVVTVLTTDLFSVSQLLGMIADSLFVSSDLVVRVRENTEKLFKRHIPQLRKFEADLKDHHDSPTGMLLHAFVSRTAHRLFDELLERGPLCYRLSGKQNNRFDELLKSIADMKLAADKCIGNTDFIGRLVQLVCEKVLLRMGADVSIFGQVQDQTLLEDDLHRVLELPNQLVHLPPTDISKAVIVAINADLGFVK